MLLTLLFLSQEAQKTVVKWEAAGLTKIKMNTIKSYAAIYTNKWQDEERDILLHHTAQHTKQAVWQTWPLSQETSIDLIMLDMMWWWGSKDLVHTVRGSHTLLNIILGSTYGNNFKCPVNSIFSYQSIVIKQKHHSQYQAKSNWSNQWWTSMAYRPFSYLQLIKNIYLLYRVRKASLNNNFLLWFIAEQNSKTCYSKQLNAGSTYECPPPPFPIYKTSWTTQITYKWPVCRWDRTVSSHLHRMEDTFP